MNNKFKVILGTFAGIMIGGITVVGANQAIQAMQNTELKVNLNGQIQTFKDETTGETQYPITYHDRTYLPLRNVANLSGLNVDYDNNSKTAILTKEYSETQLIEAARVHLKITKDYVPSLASVEEQSDDMVLIHLFDIDDDHVATSDWYTVNKYTGVGTNVMGEKIDISPENLIKMIHKKISHSDIQRNLAYQSLLMEFYSNNKLPDIPEVDISMNNEKGKSMDKFAIVDVDNDGRDELIITHENASMAGLFQVIYDYDEEKDEIYTEYFGSPISKFYENGFADVNLLHNQGRAFGFMWPYNIIKYDSQSDKYLEFAYIDGWDKNYDEAFPMYVEEKFPSEIDKDNDGGIYEVDRQFMDNADFEKWIKDNCGELVEKTIIFSSFTEENFSDIEK